MSRRRTHTPPSTPRPTPEPAPDLTRSLAVDRLLRERAAQRAAGHAPTAVIATAPVAAATETLPDDDEILYVQTFPVRGMTCRSCELRIQKLVGRIPGVDEVNASAARGRVEVVSTVPLAPARVEKAINAAGYEVGENPWLASDRRLWATAGGGLLLVVAAAVVAQATGLADLASGAGELSRGGLVVALLLGLAAGVSTCMALVGGVVLALSASYQARRVASGESAGGVATSLRPALVFMGGRIAGYLVFGALLGAIGAALAMPPQVTAVLMLVVAVVMAIVGARLTELSPRIAGWSPTLPMGLGRRLGLDPGAGGSAYTDGRAALLGAASFFLPCGFTQAVQIYALSTGSPVYGGLLLATFAIGTAPGLLALAGLPALVPSTARPTLLRVAGVVVLGFAVVNATAGLRLVGVGLPTFGTPVADAAALPAGTIENGRQALHTYQDARGYSPGNVVIYAGVPTTWTVESRSTVGCASAMVVPSLNISRRLHLGANQIDLPALPAGTLDYSCAMGMYSGRITIVDPPAAKGGPGGAG